MREQGEECGSGRRRLARKGMTEVSAEATARHCMGRGRRLQKGHGEGLDADRVRDNLLPFCLAKLSG